MSRTAKEIETTGLPCEAQNGETIQVVPKINVTMFGKFTLKQEGMEVPHAVSLTGRSRRLWTLTAYLILNRNRGVSAQELIDLLWPEAENDNPLSTLQNNVSRARAALAELGFTHAKVIIHNEKGYYRWAPDRETQLDVEQFETLAKAALAEEDMEKSVALAQEAVALYTGDFLTESAAEFWCINLNTYYRSLYTRLCRAAVDRLLKLGRITDAEKLCTGVIRLDPAAEEFSVFLMQALIKNKNPKKRWNTMITSLRCTGRSTVFRLRRSWRRRRRLRCRSFTAARRVKKIFKRSCLKKNRKPVRFAAITTFSARL